MSKQRYLEIPSRKSADKRSKISNGGIYSVRFLKDAEFARASFIRELSLFGKCQERIPIEARVARAAETHDQMLLKEIQMLLQEIASR